MFVVVNFDFFFFKQQVSVPCQLLCYVCLVGMCVFLQKSTACSRFDLREMFRVGLVSLP